MLHEHFEAIEIGLNFFFISSFYKVFIISISIQRVEQQFERGNTGESASSSCFKAAKKCKA